MSALCFAALPWAALPWAALTVALYGAALRLHARCAWAPPLVSASVALVLALHALGVPYTRYRIGGDIFSYLLGPATVALGVPMYQQAVRLRGALKRLVVVVLAGSAVGMAVAGGVAWACGAPRQIVMSTLPKSVTTPIAIQVSDTLHGNPAITAALVLLTGLLGSVSGPAMLRLARIRHDHAIGSAIGTAAHAIGTSALVRRSEAQSAAAALAMGMAGLITPVLALALAWCLS
jgi:putative effector of murein hydrolase